jgi:glyoxylase-like metal-dependent hydrolase (beta-lactamase superfamily II)
VRTIQITDHIHAKKIPFQIKTKVGTVDRFVYVYLIYDKEICLIDSGVSSSEIEIFNYIKKTDRSPEEISLVILTHSHPDHIGAIQAIKETSGCSIAAHLGEQSWIEDVEQQYRDRPIPNFHSLVGGSVKIDRILEDGDFLDLGTIRLQVFHTPGHSKGSISLFLLEDKTLIAGDVIPLVGNIPIYEDVLNSVNSIKKLRNIEGIEILLTSWDDPKKGKKAYEIMDESLNYLQHIHEVVLNVYKNVSIKSEEFCKQVLFELGLPPLIANPLITKSLEAHVKARHYQNLLED